MSYISGFMMGASLGQGLRSFFTGGKKCSKPHRAYKASIPVFSCVSCLPGRRRYRSAGLNRELALLLASRLKKLKFLKDFQLNPLTGSLLFLYDEKDESQMQLLADFLKESIFRPCSSIYEDVPSEARAGALTRSIRKSVRSLSSWIRNHTGGLLDISSAASLVFLLRGIRKMMLTKLYPSASQMLWSAVSLM